MIKFKICDTCRGALMFRIQIYKLFIVIVARESQFQTSVLVAII